MIVLKKISDELIFPFMTARSNFRQQFLTLIDHSFLLKLVDRKRENNILPKSWML